MQLKIVHVMPSKFIVEQAELLRSTKDAELVLNNMRAKYAPSSFPSQMTRLKEQWYQFGERHDSFDEELQAGQRTLQNQRVATVYMNKYLQFGKADVKTQVCLQRIAAKGDFSGSKRTDTVITNINVLPAYMSLYRLSKADKERSCKLAASSLEARSMKCVEVDNADALVRRCIGIATNLTEDPFLITAAVGVLCGRRSCEILRMGVFEPSSRGAHACLFHGAAKKRGVAARGEHIPILCNFKHLNTAVDHVRGRINTRSLTNTQMNAKYSHKLGDAAKILLESLETRFHDLRAVYAMITHSVFENTCSVNLWLKKTLLHDTIETSVFYSRCKVRNCPAALGKWAF